MLLYLMEMALPPEEPHFDGWEVQAIETFVQAIQNRFPKSEKGPVVIAIDGRGGNGKSTLAALIGKVVVDAVVVHTDDIPSSGNWLGTDRHSPPVPDSSVRSLFDWTERLLQNVLEPARAGQPVQYRPPAWEDWTRVEGAIRIPIGCPMLIVEGVGAARRELMHVVDAVIWVQSDVEQAQARGITRDGGDAGATALWETWNAQEFPFLADQKPWERADFVVCGTPNSETDTTDHTVLIAKIN